MVDRGEGFRLEFEASKPLGVARKDLGEDFDGDIAIQARIARPIDLAHPAHAKRRHDLIRAKPSARCQRHRPHLGGFRPGTLDERATAHAKRWSPSC